jgi:hypothetical protein
MNLFAIGHIKYLVLAGLVMGLWVVTQNFSEFGHAEIATLCGYLIAVIFGQALIVAVLNRISRAVSLVVAAVFAGFDVFSLLLIHNPEVIKGGLIAMVLIHVAVGALYAGICVARNEKFHRFAQTFFIVIAGIILFNFAVGLAGQGVRGEIPKHFTKVDMVRKPNIYIISFDAISPEPVVKDLLKVSGVPYDDLVRKMGGRVIPNSFSARIPTKRSINSVLAMDIRYYDGLKERYQLLRGLAPNPTYEIMWHNGYKVQFLYESNYFGGSKGNLDYYGVAKKDGLCGHVEKEYSLLGYCVPVVRSVVQRLLGVEYGQHPQILFDRIKEIGGGEQPWFTYSHIYSPGHAKNSYTAYKKEDWEEYRAQYPRRLESTMEYLKGLIETVKTHDPNAILVIMGDHGMLTSAGLMKDGGAIRENATTFDPAQLDKNSPMTFKQIVQDRHGVFMAAFLPDGICPDAFRKNPYLTQRITRDILTCLSGKDPLPMDYQRDDSDWKVFSYQ